jgi:putative transposase
VKQYEFGFLKKSRQPVSFGGELLLGKRKTKRPLSTKDPVHLVLRSDIPRVFSPRNQRLERLIYRIAKESDVQIYELAINWNHIHFVIRVKVRACYIRFVRILNSRLARANKTSGTWKCGGKLFAFRPFTRILKWARDFRNVLSYLKLNQKEARGEITRKSKLKCLRIVLGDKKPMRSVQIEGIFSC